MKSVLIAFALSLALVLAACGKKGPLEAPPQPKPEQQESQPPAGQ